MFDFMFVEKSSSIIGYFKVFVFLTLVKKMAVRASGWRLDSYIYPGIRRRPLSAPLAPDADSHVFFLRKKVDRLHHTTVIADHISFEHCQLPCIHLVRQTLQR